MNLLEKDITDVDFLQSLIPQKPPFVMVDALYHFSKTEIVSGFTIPNNHLFVFQNRFLAPGLIENMAQTVALHTGYKCFLEKKKAPIGYIGAIKKAEVLSLPEVGYRLETSVEILHDIMGITLVRAKVSCDGVVLARSEMKTALAN
ncbi:hypothetical protein FK220_014550 [Flavobacteriaceae bacterium TP-CH-4]|uniref:3-hydroxymyristoyl/3-hydroxydecanoyl-(Acyl carrier protein) dehydratase n=1 Tax=Pelagihabitans pacificus TaxID=2696054 RepID=A0A967E6I9_9FLAO|nr:hypothetical protein [Pelagihabitans pacificus]NHF60572.1 hypothetical protein [Pelagihabitans pacificus]